MNQAGAGLRLALAGGGTGGHLAPGRHLLDWLALERPPADVLWLAGDRRVDRRMLAELDRVHAGVTVEVCSLGIEGGRDAAPTRLGQLRRQPAAVARARAALRAHDSRVLLGLGGYISLPAALAARSLGIPVVLLEVNAVMGGASRLLAPLAARVAHAFAASVPAGGHGDRHVVTGPPLAPHYAEHGQHERRAAEALVRGLGLDPAAPLLLVLGGSQGAAPLNRFVRAHRDRFLSRGVQVLHQVGPGRLDEAAAPAAGYAAVEFVDPTHLALRAATAVLARAGASSLAEIGALAVPAVLVPYPQASGDHQAHNAAQLGAGAVVVTQNHLDAERAEALARLLGDEGAERRDAMARELRRRVPLDGARALADVLAAVVRDAAASSATVTVAAGSPAPEADSEDGATDGVVEDGVFEDGDVEDGEDAGGPPLPSALPRRVHLLGLGGAGVSGLARLLVARGHVVSGHDRAPSRVLEELDALGVTCADGESTAALLPPDVELVVRSAAVPEDDPQVAAARARGVPVLKYAAVLGRLAPPGRTLAITGTHGKTTTSWLTLHALRGAVADPAPGGLIGGTCLTLGTNAIAPRPDGWFCVEACEYDFSFLELRPTAAAITNVEADHLDCYGDLAGVIDGFGAFAQRIDPAGLLVVGADVPERVERAARCPVWRLGRELHVTIRNCRDGRYEFGLRGPGFELREVELSVPGRFNVENAALALALVGWAAGAGALERAAVGIAEFRGAGRRFERWLEEDGLTVVHDYAHHPTEVRVTLETAREVFAGRRLVVLFQPHQYSRTALFLDGFAAALALADEVLVADVFGARRAGSDEPAADASDLVAALDRLGARALAAGNLSSSTDAFAERLGPGSVGLVIGAGDIGTIRDALHRRLALRDGSRR